MKYLVLATTILITSCTKTYWQTSIDITTIEVGSRIGVVSSVEEKFSQYRRPFIMKIGKTVSTPFRFPVEKYVYKGIYEKFSSRPDITVIELTDLSEKLSNQYIVTTNPYYSGYLRDDLFSVFKDTSKTLNLDYVIYVEDMESVNVFQPGPTNSAPFFGLGVYSDRGTKPKVYASFRVGMYRSRDDSLVYFDRCFSYEQLGEEFGDFLDTEPLPKPTIQSAMTKLPNVILECIKEFDLHKHHNKAPKTS